MEDTKHAPSPPHHEVRGMPCGKLGEALVSRLVFDGNPLVGNVHSRDLQYVRRLARTYNTPECVRETLRIAETAGINTVLGWGEDAVRAYNAAGGQMQFIARLSPLLGGDPLADAIQRNIANGAIAQFTDPGQTDTLVREQGIAPLAAVIETAAAYDLPTGVGTWALPVVQACESADLPHDFYVQSFHADGYPTSRPTPPEIRDDYIQQTPGYFDNIWCADPTRVSEAFQRIRRPWLATKVLAAGAIDARSGLTFALEKGGADFAAVAMFDFQIEEVAQTVKRLIPRADRKRTRAWRT